MSYKTAGRGGLPFWTLFSKTAGSVFGAHADYAQIHPRSADGTEILPKQRNTEKKRMLTNTLPGLMLIQVSKWACTAVCITVRLRR